MPGAVWLHAIENIMQPLVPSVTIAISVFDLFEAGPGPSSSHTIGPMKAGYDFAQRCAVLPEDAQACASDVRVRLFGSLSATGYGHGTDMAVLAGLAGQLPASCPPEYLVRPAGGEYGGVVQKGADAAVTEGSITDGRYASLLGCEGAGGDVGTAKARLPGVSAGGGPGTVTGAGSGASGLGTADMAVRCMLLGGRVLPLTPACVVHDAVQHQHPFSNTLVIELLDGTGAVIFAHTYYSVGGGFIQWEGWQPEERGVPVHPYCSMRQLRERMNDTGLALHEIILENEMAVTGASRSSIVARLDTIIGLMEASVERGLAATGRLPGTLGVFRKANTLLSRASRLPHAVDAFLCRLNAYAFAVSEENASGGVIVTAPTCGAAGVMPAVLYAMRNDFSIGDRAVREGVLASAAVGFLAKQNAGIAGAEVGCQGEVGVASAMAAAMLAHARGNAVHVVENAAEIALEHHLGLTCDPVGGYVQIPCIERNAVGAVKAYNACLVATCEDPKHHRVTLDNVIRAMAEIGHDMNAKFKETSAGGLAVSVVEC